MLIKRERSSGNIARYVGLKHLSFRWESSCLFAMHVDDKHLKEAHTCIKKKQANVHTPSNREDAEKQDPWET